MSLFADYVKFCANVGFENPLVPEKKIFEDYLIYMVMAAILVMWLGPIEQNFISSNP